MITSIHFARVTTSFAMLCLGTSAFAQNRPAPGGDQKPPAKKPLTEKTEDISKCPVMTGAAGNQRPHESVVE